MLKSYKAIYENGQVKWLSEQPGINSARVIVTILEGDTTAANAPSFSPRVYSWQGRHPERQRVFRKSRLIGLKPPDVSSPELGFTQKSDHSRAT